MAYLEFLDGQGRPWRVWDTYPDSWSGADPGDFGRGWLTFECTECDPPQEKRRLAPVPDGWQSTTPERMRLLLRAAQEVKPASTATAAPTEVVPAE